MDRINASRFSSQMPHQAGHQAVPPANPVAAASVGPPSTLPDCCTLAAGRAVTLLARHASVLRITHGRVWLTFNPAVQAPSARAGDHFLSQGESLSLVAGEIVVMEPCGLGQPSIKYSWERAAAGYAVEILMPAGWRAGVLQPLAELRLALGLTAGALARLTQGLAVGVVAAGVGVLTGFATIFVASRARGNRDQRSFKTQSRESCARCRSR